MTSIKEKGDTQVGQKEDRRKSQKVYKFQGIRKHLDMLKEYNEKIKTIGDKITQLKERIESRVEEFRKSTGQKELFDEREELQKKIEALQKEKGFLINDLKQTSQELRTLTQTVGEEKKKLNMKSTTELKNTLANIENRIREKPLSSKDEKEISAEKNRILKLLSMQDIFKEKDEKIKEMEDRRKTKETALGIKKQELEYHYTKLTEVNNKIGKIKKTAYPEEVKKMQESVGALVEEKKSVIEKKKEEIAVMEKKSQEYELKSAEIEKAKELKNALVEQEKVVSELAKKRDSFERDLQENPGEQLKTLRSALEVQRTSLSKSSKTNLSLPFHIVNQLLQFGITIPQNIEGIEKTLSEVEAAASEEEKGFESRKEQLVKNVAETNEKIKEEKTKLENMPRPVFPRMEN